MPSPQTLADPLEDPLLAASSAKGRRAEIAETEPRNFLVLALYQIVMRTGWVFKTESIVMPAVLDMIGGSAWLRGCLPLLNRIGHSIPPMLFARRLKIMPYKRVALVLCTLAMSAVFLSMACMFSIVGNQTFSWMPAAFVAMYATFFVFTGVNSLVVGTLHGKLIAPTHRGRLLLVGGLIGASTAVTCAWFLLNAWLEPGGGRFDLIFGFAGVCFGISAIVALLVEEQPDDYRQPANSPAAHFREALQVLRDDVNFRRLTLVAALFGTSMMLFPHYQALGRIRLQLSLENLALWVVVQNTGTALFSLIGGPLADWRGNRTVLKFAMFGCCLMPLLALSLANFGSEAANVYFLVFLLVGLTPVTVRTINNYTLEVCGPAHHPRYLSTVGLCMAVPLFFSPLAGWLVDLISFEAVFIFVGAMVFAGWLLAFRLEEPRHRVVAPLPGSDDPV